LLHFVAALGDGLQLPDLVFRQPLLLLEGVYYGLHRIEELDKVAGEGLAAGVLQEHKTESLDTLPTQGLQGALLFFEPLRLGGSLDWSLFVDWVVLSVLQLGFVFATFLTILIELELELVVLQL
jgi:hypothetical protein